jgi:hypothetical protein
MTSSLTLESAICHETSSNGTESELSSEPSELTDDGPDGQHTTTRLESSLEAPLVETQNTTVTKSRLQVPASLIRQPLTEVEKLRAENRSLRHDLGKQERDLKSAKAQASSVGSKAELTSKRHENEPQKLRIQLNARFDRELNEVEGERQKATSDLRKQRDLADKLKEQKKELGQKLHAEYTDGLQNEVTALRAQIEQQTLTINVLQGRFDASAIKISRLERDVESEKRGKRDLASRYLDKSSRVVELMEQLRGATSARATTTAARNDRYRELRQKYDTLVSIPNSIQSYSRVNKSRNLSPKLPIDDFSRPRTIFESVDRSEIQLDQRGRSRKGFWLLLDRTYPPGTRVSPNVSQWKRTEILRHHSSKQPSKSVFDS